MYFGHLLWHAGYVQKELALCDVMLDCLLCLRGVPTSLLIFSCFFRQYQYAVSILETGGTAGSYIAFYRLLYLEIFFSFPFSTPASCAASINLNTDFTHTLSFQKTL